MPACHRGVAVAPRRSRPATRGVPAHLLRSTARDHGLTGRRRPGSQNPRAARSGGARVKAPVVSPSAHRAGRRRGAARSDEEDTTRGVALSFSLFPLVGPSSQSRNRIWPPPLTSRIGAERTARRQRPWPWPWPELFSSSSAEAVHESSSVTERRIHRGRGAVRAARRRRAAPVAAAHAHACRGRRPAGAAATQQERREDSRLARRPSRGSNDAAACPTAKSMMQLAQITSALK